MYLYCICSTIISPSYLNKRLFSPWPPARPLPPPPPPPRPIPRARKLKLTALDNRRGSNRHKYLENRNRLARRTNTRPEAVKWLCNSLRIFGWSADFLFKLKLIQINFIVQPVLSNRTVYKMYSVYILKVPSGQIGSAWEWYHWKAL